MKHGNFTTDRSKSRLILSISFLLLAGAALAAQADDTQSLSGEPTLIKASGAPTVESDCRHHPV